MATSHLFGSVGVMCSPDHNLLFGILALQNGFVVEKQLICAMNAWVLDKQTPLAQILLHDEAIKLEELELLETLVARHLAAHGDSPEQSLAAIGALSTIGDELRRVADSDLQASLMHFAQPPALDPCATMAGAIGDSTSAGSRFQILRPYAKGGLGEVFVAKDEELGREVALKQIQNQFADQADCRSRFLQEAEITGSLEHPNIVPVYGLGAYADGRPFYAMRFIRGESLKDAIDQFHKADNDADEGPRRRRLELRKLLRCFIDACNAIEYAHSRGVLHRDLKPGNIMLGKYGETLVVDWGMAKVIGRRDSQEKHSTVIDEVSLRLSLASDSAPTQMGAAIGTPQYMSPEQAAGRHDALGPTSDVYSLGATLYCLLTGKSPLADKNCADLGEMLRHVQQGDITPPRQISAAIPKPLKAICQMAMANDPADRYQSPRALADDLEHWLADEPTIAHPESLCDRLFRVARRHRAVAISTTAAAILIAFVASIAGFRINALRQDADQSAQENMELAHSEQQLRIQAQSAAEDAKIAREKADQFAKEKEASARKAEQSTKEAEAARVNAESATENAKSEREKAVASAARAEAERAKAQKFSEFLIGTIQPEDPTRFSGATFFAPKADANKYTVVEMLRVEVARAREELKQEPLAQAAVFDSIGDVCRQLAIFKSAQKLLTEALKIRQDHLGSDDPDLATSYYHTAWYYHERGDFEKAEPLYLEAIRIQRMMPNGQRLVADTLQNLAWLYYYDQASQSKMDKCFEEALGIREKLLHDAPADRRKALLRDVVYTQFGMASAWGGQARVIKARGVVSNEALIDELVELHNGRKTLAQAIAHYVNAIDDHNQISDSGDAVEELKNALAYLLEGGESETMMEVTIRYDLMRALMRANRMREAETHYSTLIEIARGKQMLQIPEQADKINNFAYLLLKLGKANDALDLWDEYLAAQEFRFGAQHRFYKEATAAQQQFLKANISKIDRAMKPRSVANRN